MKRKTLCYGKGAEWGMKQLYKTRYYGFCQGQDSVYSSIMKCRQLVDDMDQFGQFITLLRMDYQENNIYLRVSRDDITLDVDESGYEHTIRYWRTCGAFKNMTKQAFEQLVLDSFLAYQKKKKLAG